MSISLRIHPPLMTIVQNDSDNFRYLSSTLETFIYKMVSDKIYVNILRISTNSMKNVITSHPKNTLNSFLQLLK